MELQTSWHERHAARRPGLPCKVSTLAGYPYPCPAEDIRPADIIRLCVTHGTWWAHNPETGECRTDELERTLAEALVGGIDA